MDQHDPSRGPRYGQQYLFDRTEVDLPQTKRAKEGENHHERAILFALATVLVFVEWCRAAMRPMPRTRLDCVDGSRPCRFTQCRYHTNAGDALGCTLDYADRNGMTEDEIAKAIGVSRQGISIQYLESLAALKRVGGPRLRVIADEMATQDEDAQGRTIFAESENAE